MSSYLVMVVPITLYRIATALRTDRHGGHAGAILAGAVLLSAGVLIAGWGISLTAGAVAVGTVIAGWAALRSLKLAPSGLAAAGYLVLLSLQVSCIAFSESRGPFLGLLAGVGLFGLLACLVFGTARSARIVLIVFAALLGCLIAINIPGLPLSQVTELPVIGRLTRVLSTEGSAQVRLLIWAAIAQLIENEPWRLLFGYGLDTMRVVLQPYYAPELAQLTNPDNWPDRAHNDSLDWLVTTGFSGLIVYTALVVAALVTAVRTAGVARDSRAGGRLAVVLTVGILTTGLVAGVTGGSWQFLGLALPVGLALGLSGFLIASAFGRRARRSERSQQNEKTALLSAALAAALITHIVESHVGIATVSSRLMFWTICGLIVACSTAPLARRTVEQPKLPNDTSNVELAPSLLAGAFLVGLTLGVDFLRVSESELASLHFASLVAASLAVMVLVVLAVRANLDPRPRISALELFGYLGAANLSGLLAARLATDLLIRQGSGLGPIFIVYLAIILAAVIVASLASQRGPEARIPAGVPALTSLAGLALATAAIAWHLDAKLVHADEAAKLGWQAELGGDTGASVTAYRAAIDRAPDQDRYHGLLGAAYAKHGMKTADAAERDHLFASAERAFRRAATLAPLDVDHVVSMARLHVIRANMARADAQRSRYLERASAAYAVSVKRAPTRPALWTEWSRVAAALGETESAMERRERARALKEGR